MIYLDECRQTYSYCHSLTVAKYLGAIVFLVPLVTYVHFR